MKKKEQDSPLFSDSIMSTEDIFEDEDFGNNGLNLDLDHESLNDREPVQAPTVPLEAPLDQGSTEPIYSDTQEIFTEEPLQESLTSRQVPFKTQPVKVKPTAEQLYSESYTDEPKKNYRKPLIIGLIFIVVAFCLVWFVLSFFSSNTNTENNVQTQTTTEQRQNNSLFNNRNNTQNNKNNNNNNSTNNTQNTTKPSQTQQPTTTPDNSTNNSNNGSNNDYPSYTYPDDNGYDNDYYPDDSNDSYYPDDSQNSGGTTDESTVPETIDPVDAQNVIYE